MAGIREQKKEEKQERLLQAAIDLFTRRGFESTSIEDITHQAGVAKGTFYNFYTRKEDVLLHYLDRELVKSRHEVERKIDSQETIIDRLELLVFTYLKYIFRSKDFAKVLVRERVCRIGTGSNWNEIVLLRSIMQLLEEARGNGEIRAEVDLSGLAELIFGIFTMYTIYWLNGFIKTKKACVEKVGSVLRMVFDGVGPL